MGDLKKDPTAFATQHINEDQYVPGSSDPEPLWQSFDSSALVELGLRAMGGFAYEIDHLTGRTVFTDGIEQVLGVSAAERPSTYDGWLTYLSPDDAETVLSTFSELKKKKSSEFSVDYSILCTGDQKKSFRDRGLLFFGADNELLRTVGFVADITAERETADYQNMLMRELDHRVKNILQRVLTILRQSSRKASSLDDFIERVEARIQSMARINDLLIHNQWTQVPLDQVISQELDAFSVQDQTSYSGPTVRLRPRAAQAFSMIAHELATNAAKYGAFCSEGGRLDIEWSISPQADGLLHFHLSWNEKSQLENKQQTDEVPTAAEGGFGSKLIDLLCRAELHGSAKSNYKEDGLVFTLTAPLSELSSEHSFPAPQPTRERTLQSPAASPTDAAPSSEIEIKPYRFVALAQMWPVDLMNDRTQTENWEMLDFLSPSKEIEFTSLSALPDAAVVDLGIDLPRQTLARYILKISEAGVPIVFATDNLDTDIDDLATMVEKPSMALFAELIAKAPRVRKPFSGARLATALDIATAKAG